MPETTCAVTGASGYLGSRLSSALRRHGVAVHELSRRGPVPFSLESGPPEDLLERIDSLIHCAWDFRPTAWPDIHRTNVLGSLRLLSAARRAGVRNMVFISTISAFDGCESRYGQAKRAVELEAMRLGAVVVRPGLIHGERPGSLMRSLTAMCALPLVPLIGDGRQLQYLTHEDDLARLAVRLASGGSSPEPIIAANDQPWELREILRSLAASHGRTPKFVPVPWRLCHALLKLKESTGLRSGFRSDSVISLMNQNPHPDFTATRAFGVAFRVFRPCEPKGKS